MSFYFYFNRESQTNKRQSVLHPKFIRKITPEFIKKTEGKERPIENLDVVSMTTHVILTLTTRTLRHNVLGPPVGD